MLQEKNMVLFDANMVLRFLLDDDHDTLILTPRSLLIKSMRHGLSLISDDFMEDGRPDEIQAERDL